jgi:hypothetical protein
MDGSGRDVRRRLKFVASLLPLWWATLSWSLLSERRLMPPLSPKAVGQETIYSR